MTEVFKSSLESLNCLVMKIQEDNLSKRGVIPNMP